MHRFVWAWPIFAVLMATSARADDTAGIDFFEKKVRPILVEHCYSCHSGAALKLKAGLRLDSRAAMLRGGDNGPAIVSEKPAESRLVRAIHYDDVELRMPPKGKLPAAAIADLTEWIQRGAAWPTEVASQQTVSAFDLAKRKSEHWAWRPIQAESPPTVRHATWPRSAVDRFILAKLEADHLKPAAAAAAHELLRRVYFDIIGLPPPADVARSFAADSSPVAFEQIVDRLLASPQFGERWARHWLDLVRYAETRGNEFDYHNPNAWQYRDYVIRALNADVPYNQFVTEHLAGDLLSQPRRNPGDRFNESILGTGGWFFGDQVHSPVDLRQDQADHLDTMIDVFSKTFLGLTVSCARCHDHKFDAISTKDYYALVGVFASTGYRQVRLDPGSREHAVAEQLRALEEKLSPAIRAELAAKLREAISRAREPLVLKVAGVIPAGARVVIDYADAPPADWRPDAHAFGAAPRKIGNLILGGARVRVNWRASAVVNPAWISLKASGQNDPGDLGKAWRAGRTIRTPTVTLASGRLYYLMRGKAFSYAAVQGHQMMEGPLHRNLVKPIDAGAELRWVEQDLRRYVGHQAHVEFTATSPDFAIAAVIEADEPPAVATPQSVEPDEFLPAVVRFAEGKCDSRSAAIVDALLAQATLNEGPALAEFGARRQEILSALPTTSQLAPAMLDGNGVDERVFIRGNPKNLGEPAPRRFLEALNGDRSLAGPGSGRLELARRVTDPAINPLISRVIVNRVWHHLFGRGIVASVDNFGALGDKPTHPELLDWLADDFVRHGWSIKQLIRSLVLSNTYRMASNGDAATETADPQNRLWHRAEIRRLEGEAIRDSILGVAGSLDSKMFGPPVPIHLTPFMEGRGRPGRSGPLDGAGRRSIYLEVRRNFLDPFLTTFDQPAPGNTVGRRSVSNVPAQALVLLNDPFVHEQAERWAMREMEIGGSTDERIERMYWTAFSRGPMKVEMETCRAFLGNRDAWAELAHALLNVKEFIYIR
jgi:Protein of unknown function (DUF1553)/Protein of unknown function (DUF1549)/Planctomycete cytochrome C